MRRIVISFVFIVISLTAFCQGNDAYKTFVSKIDGSRAEFTYSYSTGLETKMTGKGRALVQGSCFYLAGNGSEIYCDGKTAATIDRESREVILETVDGEDQGSYVNPAVLIASISKEFKAVKQSNVSYAGKPAVKVVLEPRRSLNVLRITIHISPDGSQLRSASMTMDDGSSSDFVLPSFRFLPSGNISDFRLDTKSLGKGYIITDLR